MKVSLFFSIIVVFVHAPIVLSGISSKLQDSSDSSDSSESSDSVDSSEISKKTNNIKLTKSRVLKVSSKYFCTESFKTQVVKVNETFNRLAIEYFIKKDFPSNVVYTVDVYRSTKSKDGHYKELINYSVPLCNDSDNKYRKYLPDNLIKLTQSGKCIQKGYYESSDPGVFKFYELLSEEELKGPYFKAIIDIKSEYETIQSVDLRFETVCTK